MNGQDVLGTGIDLIETERMQESLQRWGARFTHKIFSDHERAYCDARVQPWRHYAGRFAVKEAVSKAFGTGIGKHLGWRDIEVVRSNGTSAPTVQLSPRAQTWSNELGVQQILVSLSHTRRYAVAHALLVGRKPAP